MATTIREFYSTKKTGLLEDLNTTAKGTFVSAINEVDDSVSALEIAFASPYKTDTTYAVGDYVRYNKNDDGYIFYRCNTAITTPEPWNASHWTACRVSTELNAVFKNITSNYSDSNTYEVGDYVIYNRGMYRCNTAITTPEPWNASHWAACSVASELNAVFYNVAPDYSSSSTYEVGDYVVYYRHIYRCNTAITTPEPWNASHWDLTRISNELFRQSKYVAIPYSSASTYNVGDYVSVGPFYYRCNTAITTAEAWNPDHWTNIRILPEAIRASSRFLGKSMVMFGDSIVYAAHDDTKRGGYVSRLRTLLGFTTAVNRGVSGYSIADGNPTHPEGSINTVVKSESDYTLYDLAIVAGGTNDFRRSLPLGTLGDSSDLFFDTTTFYGSLRSIVEHILQQNPKIELSLWTPLQRNKDGYDIDYVNAVGCRLIDYVNAIKDVGRMYGVPVVDLYTVSGLNSRTLIYYTDDGVHLNGAGYDCITPIAAEYLKLGLFEDDSNMLSSIADVFDATTGYSIGDYVIQNGMLYRCTSAHIGSWDSSDFVRVNIGDELKSKSQTLTFTESSDGNIVIS